MLLLLSFVIVISTFVDVQATNQGRFKTFFMQFDL